MSSAVRLWHIRLAPASFLWAISVGIALPFLLSVYGYVLTCVGSRFARPY